VVPAEAGQQGGVFTRQQALAAGVPAGTINSRLAGGRWLRVLPRVYSAGPVDIMARLHAATLWLPHGTVSHLAAAWLWGLLDEPDIVHVTVPLRCTRNSPQPWLRLVRRDLQPHHCWDFRGLPVVPPQRSVLDCAAVLDRSAAGRLFDRAIDGRILLPELRAQYWADLGRRGSRHACRQLVSAVAGAASEPERLLARACHRAGLRGLRVNRPLLGFVVDLLDSDLRLIVEVDGYRDHSDRAAFHRDRVRQNALVAAGYTVLRFTAVQVMHDVRSVAAEIAAVAHRLGGLSS
jgi:very-short-patch-repair endonuclease